VRSAFDIIVYHYSVVLVSISHLGLSIPRPAGDLRGALGAAGSAPPRELFEAGRGEKDEQGVGKETPHRGASLDVDVEDEVTTVRQRRRLGQHQGYDRWRVRDSLTARNTQLAQG